MNTTLDKQNSAHSLATVTTEEIFHGGEDSHLESQHEERSELPDSEMDSEPLYCGAGSGEDDLADFNDNEANDYVNE